MVLEHGLAMTGPLQHHEGRKQNRRQLTAEDSVIRLGLELPELDDECNEGIRPDLDIIRISLDGSRSSADVELML